MMHLNFEILDEVKKYDANILVVSKYFDKEKTQEIYEALKNKKEVLALGENRIEDIEKKNIPQEFCHYIGRLQSRKLKKIIKYCGVIHGLDNLIHAEKLNNILEEKKINEKLKFQILGVFVQINISGEIQKGGIEVEDVADFLKVLKNYKNLKVLGFSGMGNFDSSLEDKKREFKILVDLKNKFLPLGQISAGTSVDYKIALEEGISIVRVGRGFFA